MAHQIRVAVMGSSGYVGRNLARAISDKYADVKHTPISRDGVNVVYSLHHVFEFLESYREHWSSDTYYDYADDEYFEIVDGHSPADLAERLHGSDVLVNLSGSGRQSAKNPYSASVEASATVAAFTCKEAGIPIVHVSGLGASSSAPIAYLASKYAAESVIRNSGLRYVILRPSYIVGRGDHLSSYVRRHARQAKTTTRRSSAAGTRGRSANTSSSSSVDVYESARPMQPIHIDDVISVMMWAVRRLVDPGRKTYRITLDLVGPDKIPFYDYMNKLAENAGVGTNPISMEEAYVQALKDPESAPFGVDDLGLIAGGYTGNYKKLAEKTGIRPKSVVRMLESGGIP